MRTPRGATTALRLAIKIEAANPIAANYFEANDLPNMTPDIDLLAVITLWLDGGTILSVSTTMEGDLFPNAEAFLVFGELQAGAGGKSPTEGKMLHHFETQGGPNSGPALYLPGDDLSFMGTSTARIQVTPP